jgi:hypothetical protein
MSGIVERFSWSGTHAVSRSPVRLRAVCQMRSASAGQAGRRPGTCHPRRRRQHHPRTALPRPRPDARRILPATQAEQDDRNRARAEELSRQLAQNETAQNGLIAQLERLGSDTSPADAMRQRITDQFTERYNQGKELQAQRQHQGQALRRIRHTGPVPSPQETSHHLANHHQRHTRHRRRPHRRPPHR